MAAGSDTDSLTSANLRRTQSSMSFSSKGSALPRFSTKPKKTKETLKNRLVEAKIREEVAKRKHKERLYRRKLISKQKRLQEELEYLHFPTMLGWYFDGFFTHHFALNQEWADIFNAIEEDLATRKELDEHETFPEMTARNFWPPRVYGNLAFRGRGVYMDFREVIRDPPSSPPEIHATKEDEDASEAGFTSLQMLDALTGYPIASEEDGLSGEEGPVHKFRGATHKTRFKVTGKGDEEINKHDFYFNEDEAQFHSKDDEDIENLYFDQRFGVWRRKRAVFKYNGDWFFHDREGVFKLKDHTKTYIYYFDNVWNVWKMKEVYGPSVNGLLPKDYYYDEAFSEWLRKKGAPPDTFTFDENGWRASKRIPLTGPDDYFFNEDKGDFDLKPPGKARDYYYDPIFGAWRVKGPPNPRRIHSPSDFYFNEQDGTFKKKDAPSAHFEYDQNNRFFRKKRLLNGPHNPRNWTWDNNQRRWVPKTSNRSNIFTQVLNWRPQRDYDKPWLDYVGGYNQRLRDRRQAKAASAKSSHIQTPSRKQEPSQFSIREPPSKTLDQILAEKAEWGDPAFKSSANRIPFDSKGPGFVSEARSGAISKKMDEVETASAKPPPPPEAIIDRSIDRKRLKCGNLNGMISSKELKAFFVSASACTKPKDKHPQDKDDYMYIQFLSDQAAAAAIRTMQHADIKGQKIQLSYPRRFQK